MKPNTSDKMDLFELSIKKYHDALKNRSSKDLQSFLADTKALEVLVEDQERYTKLRMCRFDACKWIGEFQAAQREYQAFVATYPQASILDWVYKLSDLYFTAFVYASGSEADKWIEVMKKMVSEYKKREEANTLNRYHRLALANIEAFALIYSGQKDKVLDLYKTFQFQPIELKLCNDESALPFLYGNYMKGLWCAILLKDKQLLKDMLKVVSIDDQTLYGENDLFTLFYKTVLDVVDTKPSFRNEFNLFFMKKKWNDHTSDIAYVMNSIRVQLTSALSAYFGEFK